MGGSYNAAPEYNEKTICQLTPSTRTMKHQPVLSLMAVKMILNSSRMSLTHLMTLLALTDMMTLRRHQPWRMMKMLLPQRRRRRRMIRKMTHQHPGTGARRH